VFFEKWEYDTQPNTQQQHIIYIPYTYTAAHIKYITYCLSVSSLRLRGARDWVYSPDALLSRRTPYGAVTVDTACPRVSRDLVLVTLSLCTRPSVGRGQWSYTMV
jgi:hypothetical protein